MIHSKDIKLDQSASSELMADGVWSRSETSVADVDFRFLTVETETDFTK